MTVRHPPAGPLAGHRRWDPDNVNYGLSAMVGQSYVGVDTAPRIVEMSSGCRSAARGGVRGLRPLVLEAPGSRRYTVGAGWIGAL